MPLCEKLFLIRIFHSTLMADPDSTFGEQRKSGAKIAEIGRFLPVGVVTQLLTQSPDETIL